MGIVGNQLQSTSTGYNTDWLGRPPSEATTDQHVRCRQVLGTSADTGHPIVAPFVLLRLDITSHTAYGFAVGQSNGQSAITAATFHNGVFGYSVTSLLSTQLTAGQEIIVHAYAVGSVQIATVALASNESAILGMAVLNDYSILSGSMGIGPHHVDVSRVNEFSVYTSGITLPAHTLPKRRIGINSGRTAMGHLPTPSRIREPSRPCKIRTTAF